MHQHRLVVSTAHFLEVVYELATLDSDVFVCDLVVPGLFVETESWGRRVVVEQHVGQNVVVLRRTGEELQALLLVPLVPVLVVHSGEEPPVKPHLTEQTGLTLRVSERVDLPPDRRNRLFSEVLQNPLVSPRHVVYNVLVISGGFVVHGNPSVRELKLVVFD